MHGSRGRSRVLPVLIATLGGLTVSGSTRAHVDYVSSDPGGSPGALEVLSRVLADPGAAAVLGGGALAVGLAGLAWLRWGEAVTDARVLVGVLEGYGRFVPWMLRLSVGLPLVGAGFAGFLFTPVVETSLRLPQVLVGFALLLGLATRASAVAGLVGWLVAAVVHGQPLLLAGEYVGGFLAIAVLGPGQPSADHLLQRVAEDPTTVYHRLDSVHAWAERVQSATASLRRLAPVLVRVPLGLTFVYLGVAEKLADPGAALALAHDLGLAGVAGLEAEVWVVGAGLVEVAVGLALVLGLFTRAAGAAAFGVLTVTLLALPNDPVLPHVTLFGLASVMFTLGAGPLSVDRLLERASIRRVR